MVTPFQTAAQLPVPLNASGGPMPDTSLAPVQQETRRRDRAVSIAIAARFSVGVVETAPGRIVALESLIEEGIHTLFDGVDSIVVPVAEFGHGKFEALGATVEDSFVLVATGAPHPRRLAGRTRVHSLRVVAVGPRLP